MSSKKHDSSSLLLVIPGILWLIDIAIICYAWCLFLLFGIIVTGRMLCYLKQNDYSRQLMFTVYVSTISTLFLFFCNYLLFAVWINSSHLNFSYCLIDNQLPICKCQSCGYVKTSYCVYMVLTRYFLLLISHISDF